VPMVYVSGWHMSGLKGLHMDGQHGTLLKITSRVQTNGEYQLSLQYTYREKDLCPQSKDKIIGTVSGCIVPRIK
jgi:hypothetical protein